MAVMRWSALIAGAALSGIAGGAQAQGLAAGKTIFEIRPRLEIVDQANLPREAVAATVRMRFGYETAAWNDLKGLVEFEGVQDLGDEQYNSTVNGKVIYPVIGDPPGAEINRLQVSWTPSKAFGAVLGRQRINLDDQRFVGGAAWRQDEQTFDAARADLAYGKFKGSVIYVDNVNRVFAEKADWKSDSWLVNAGWDGPAVFKPTAFVYALDFDNSAFNSTLTAGVRVTGKTKAGPVALAYAASYANQEDYGNNPASFNLDYWAAELAGTSGAVTVKGAYESLEGNGRRGFQTPLATLHAFQGWADVFLITPPNGIEDANLSLTFKPKWRGPNLFNIELTARYHNFEAERGGADLGDEIDLLAQAAITKQLTMLAKWADYDGVAGFPSRRKFWFGFEFKL
ncbi:MAG: alginate export family protein [Phenylobacterium sp.]